jgi:hypothetical protein
VARLGFEHAKADFMVTLGSEFSKDILKRVIEVVQREAAKVALFELSRNIMYG